MMLMVLHKKRKVSPEIEENHETNEITEEVLDI